MYFEKGVYMRKTTIVDLVTAVVPHTCACGTLLKAYWKKQLNEKMEIALSEIRQGTLDKINTDDRISVAYRISRSISEGVANHNFRLICRLLQGLSDNNKLTAKTFARFASILDTLTEDELKVIAYDIWMYKNPNPNISKETRTKMEKGPTIITWEESNEYKDWKQKASEFVNSLNLPINTDSIFDRLVSGGKYIVKGENPFSTIHYSLLRTGLYSLNILTKQQNEAGDGKGCPIFEFSPLMMELMEYVDFYLESEQ